LELSPESRILYYTLLSGLLADAVDLSALSSGLSVRRDDPLLQSLVKMTDEWVEREEAETRLRQEYANLFLLPGGVKPYESVYRGSEPMLMQQPWVDVKRFYRRCGWHLDESALPEDHVSVELSFMAHLLSDGEHDESSEFFHQHLNQWIPQLLRDIAENRYADFYQSVTDYGLAFLCAETEICEGKK